MPASNKMLKTRQHAANRAAGIGDEDGKLPARIKAPNVLVKCLKCLTEIRMTKTNTEAKAHAESRHPGIRFSECFPGQFDPTQEIIADNSSHVTQESIVMKANDVAEAKDESLAIPKKSKKKEDLSFLDASLNFDAKKIGGKKK